MQPNGGTVDQYLRAPLAYLRHFRDADLVVDVANGLSFYAPAWRRGPSICFVNHIHTDQWDQWFPKPVAAVGRLMEQHAMPAAYRNRLFVAVSPSTAEGLESASAWTGTASGSSSTGPTSPTRWAPSPRSRCSSAWGAWSPTSASSSPSRPSTRSGPIVGGRLVIAGNGPELERLRATAGPGAELPGRITEEEKLDLLGSAWLMVHPASHEGWGLVITEAAAYGTPSLAFRVPGLQDSIVDGMSGILVDRPEELAETWLRIAQDPALRAQLREGARRRAAACTWEHTVERFEEICEEAVEPHRRSLRIPHGAWTGSGHRAPLDPDRPELAGLPVGTGRPQLHVVRDRPDLSIVLPAFNEGARLPVSIPVLLEHLAERGRAAPR